MLYQLSYLTEPLHPTQQSGPCPAASIGELVSASFEWLNMSWPAEPALPEGVPLALLAAEQGVDVGEGVGPVFPPAHPHPFSRCPTTVLHALSTTPLPMGHPLRTRVNRFHQLSRRPHPGWQGVREGNLAAGVGVPAVAGGGRPAG